MKNKAKRNIKGILGGTISLTAATLMVKVLGLVYKIPLSYILGDGGMGYFNSAYTIYSIFYIISVSGVPKAITILVAESRAEGKDSYGDKIYNVALRIFTLLGVLICLLLLIMSPALSSFIKNKQSMYSLMLIAPSIVFTASSGVMRGMLCADLEFLKVAKSQVIDAAGKAVFGIVLALIAFKLGFDAPMISAFTISGATIGSIISYFYLKLTIKCKDTSKNAGQNLPYFNERKEILNKITKIAFPLTIGAVAMNITSLIDLGLIMRRLMFLGYSELQANSLYGNYTTMVTPLLNLATSLITPITISVMPMLTVAYTNKNREEFNQRISESFKLIAALAVPLFFGMAFYSKEALVLIFEDKGAEMAAPLLTVCAPAVLFMSFNLLINTALEASGNVNTPIYTTLISALVKAILSYVLIGNPNIGISGASISTVVFYSVSFIIGGSILIFKCKYKLPFLSAIFLPFINSILMVYISKNIMIKVFSNVSGEIYSILSIGICALIYAILVLCEFLLSKNNKKVRQIALKRCKKII